MKKIIIVTWQYPPEAVGRASRMHEMAKFLKKFHKVMVIAPPPVWPYTKFKKVSYLSNKEKIEDVDVLRIWNVQPSKLKPSFFEKIGMSFFFPFLVSLYFLVSLHGVSTIIVSAQPPPILSVTLIPRLFRKKIILDIGDLEYEPELENKFQVRYRFIKKIYKKFELYCWKKTDLIFTNVLGISEKLKSFEPNIASKVKYLPYNIDTEHFKKQDVKKEKQIIYIGMFGPLQNISPLIHSMKIISLENSDLKLKLYGGGPCEQDLKKLVEELKLEGICEFNNPVPREKIPEILSKSQLGIVPLVMNDSLNFATPTKLFEYLACGLPVFSYGPSEAIEKILKDTDSGEMIKSDDPKLIAQEILKLVKDRERLDAFSKNGRSFIENKMDFPTITDLI